MLRKTFLAGLFILLCTTFSMNIFAEVPHLINYQGKLTDASDNPLDGTYTVIFKIYNSAAGGTSLWQETKSVSVKDGIFNVFLGSTTPLTTTIFNGNDKYLSIKVGSDPEMIQRKRLVSVGYSLRTEEADEAKDADKLDGFHASAFVRTVDGVTPNSSGNIDLRGANGITITPGFATNQITISGSGAGDNLGNHTAEENIKLNGHWLSGDGGNEGITVDNSGNIIASGGYFRIGAPSSSYAAGDIAATSDLLADDNIVARNGYIKAGSPSTSYGAGDIAAVRDVIADDDVIAKDCVAANDGSIRAGFPASSYSAGDIAATSDLLADDNVIARNGYIKSGSTSFSPTAGDVAAADDLWADDNVMAKTGFIITGSPSSPYSNGDIVATANVRADGWVTAGSAISASGDLVTQQTVYVHGMEGSALSLYDVRFAKDGSKKLYYNTSSSSYKEDIHDLHDDFHKILQVKPRSFKDKELRMTEIGYIAEEFDQLGLKNLVIYENDQPMSIKYDLIVLYVIEVLKKQQETIEMLKNQLQSAR